jgi:Ni,Fe-hydrogenase III small subunit/ferredoxin
MLEWIPRALRAGRATTRYPYRAEPPPAGYHGSVEVLDASSPNDGLAAVCPTGAILASDLSLTVDRARCVLCGECVRRLPDRFAFVSRYETAARTRPAFVVGDSSQARLEGAAGRALAQQARALRRSIHVRHIDTGSDGAEEWEIQALWNPYYDIQRLGFFLTAAPRHADILLVTGAVTAPMRKPLELTWEVMPAPKALVAVGSEACSGSLTDAGGWTAGGVEGILPVDVYVPGSPPAPIAILHGLLLAVGLLGDARSAAA